MEAYNTQQQIMDIQSIYGCNNPHLCSYCSKGNTTTWSFTKQKMKPYTYQLLMERGWRRCGDYYYKNNLAVSCCKQWTLRQNATCFKIKKDQKKTVKKMMGIAYELVNMTAQSNKKIPQIKTQAIKTKTKIIVEVQEELKNMMFDKCKKITETIKQQSLLKLPNNQFNFNVLQKLKFFSSQEHSKGDYYCNYVMLLFGINKKIYPKQYTIHNFIAQYKQIIEKIGSNQNCKVQVQRNGYLIFTLTQKEKKDKSNQFQIIQIQKPKKIQQQLDIKKQLKKEESQQCQIVKPVYNGQINISTDCITFGRLKVQIVPVQQSEQSFRMYKRYCSSIHEKQEKSMSSYIRFLCVNGLNSQKQIAQNKQQKFYIPSWDPQQKYQKRKLVPQKVTKKLGCFHMKYYLNQQFIGVGVVDIVPTGLSSVYYFYEPKYKQNRLGVFSTIIQIQYVRYLSLSFPQFKYYYMGFYIQNCQKMKYKGDYQPTTLLCPITYQFVQVTQQIRQLIDKINAKQINSVRLSPNNVQILPDMNFNTDIGVYINSHLKLKYQNQVLNLPQINPKFFVPILVKLKTYIQVWGKQLFNIFTFQF